MGLTLVWGCILDPLPSTETDLATVAEAGKAAGTLVTGVVGGHSEPKLTVAPWALTGT